MKPFNVTSKDEFNDQCRSVFTAACGKYGVTPTEWAKTYGRNPRSVENWLSGRKNLTMGFLIDLMTAVGCTLTLTPPESWKAPRQRKPRQRMWPI